MTVVLNTHSQAWRDQAECVGMDPDLFVPKRGKNVGAAAKAACGRCPVRAECLDYAVTRNLFGYWGGTTDRQRVTARAERRKGQSVQVHAAAVRRERALIMAGLGMSPESIAAQLNVDQRTVFRYLREVS